MNEWKGGGQECQFTLKNIDTTIGIKVCIDQTWYNLCTTKEDIIMLNVW